MSLKQFLKSLLMKSRIWEISAMQTELLLYLKSILLILQMQKYIIVLIMHTVLKTLKQKV